VLISIRILRGCRELNGNNCNACFIGNSSIEPGAVYQVINCFIDRFHPVCYFCVLHSIVTRTIAMLVFVHEDIGVNSVRAKGIEEIHGLCILIFA
jgi:hypothetical protein